MTSCTRSTSGAGHGPASDFRGRPRPTWTTGQVRCRDGCGSTTRRGRTSRISTPSRRREGPPWVGRLRVPLVHRYRVPAEHAARPVAADGLRRRRPDPAERLAELHRRRPPRSTLTSPGSGLASSRSSTRPGSATASSSSPRSRASSWPTSVRSRRTSGTLDGELRERIAGWTGCEGRTVGLRPRWSGDHRGVRAGSQSFHAFYDFLLSSARQGGVHRPAGARARRGRPRPSAPIRGYGSSLRLVGGR